MASEPEVGLGTARSAEDPTEGVADVLPSAADGADRVDLELKRLQRVCVNFLRGTLEKSEAIPALQDVIRAYVEKVLEATHGDVPSAARIMGIARQKLYNYIRKTRINILTAVNGMMSVQHRHLSSHGREYSYREIENALWDCKGNMAACARRLGINTSTLRYFVMQTGIDTLSMKTRA